VINRRQARYILHNVNEVSRILQSRLCRDPFHDSITVTRAVTAEHDDATSNRFYRRLTNILYTHGLQYIPLALAVCMVITSIATAIIAAFAIYPCVQCVANLM